MKYREWIERGDRASDPMDRFNCYWYAFNNLYSEFEGRSEIHKIQSFTEAAVSAGRAASLLGKWDSQVAYLMSKPVHNVPDNGRNTEQYIREFNQADDCETRLERVLLVIYRVRCNLIHGQKSPSRLRDQELCGAAAPLIADIVRCVES